MFRRRSHAPDVAPDRRTALRALGVTALAGGAAVVGARPADAAAGSAVLQGQTNSYSGTTTLTSTTNNALAVSSPSGTRAISVQVSGSAIGVDVLAESGTAVSAEATGSGDGLIAYSGSGFAVQAQTDSGTGVQAHSSSGTGAQIASDKGIALVLEGPVLHFPLPATGAPAAGPNYQVGSLVRDKLGDLYVLTQAGWLRTVGVRPGYVGGAQHQLAAPVRLLDTRAGKSARTSGGGKYGNGSTHTLQVAGLTYAGATIPSDATAVIGNLTSTGSTAPGYVTAFASGASRPTASNLNYGKAQSIANAVTVTVGTNGSIELYVAGGATDLLFDVSAFLA